MESVSRVAYGENRSLGDTSMKLGTNCLHMILMIKNVCSQYEIPRWPPKSKMAATKFIFFYIFVSWFLESDKDSKNKKVQKHLVIQHNNTDTEKSRSWFIHETFTINTYSFSVLNLNYANWQGSYVIEINIYMSNV